MEFDLLPVRGHAQCAQALLHDLFTIFVHDFFEAAYGDDAFSLVDRAIFDDPDMISEGTASQTAKQTIHHLRIGYTALTAGNAVRWRVGRIRGVGKLSDMPAAYAAKADDFGALSVIMCVHKCDGRLEKLLLRHDD